MCSKSGPLVMLKARFALRLVLVFFPLALIGEEQHQVALIFYSKEGRLLCWYLEALLFRSHIDYCSWRACEKLRHDSWRWLLALGKSECPSIRTCSSNSFFFLWIISVTKAIDSSILDSGPLPCSPKLCLFSPVLFPSVDTHEIFIFHKKKKVRDKIVILFGNP